MTRLARLPPLLIVLTGLSLFGPTRAHAKKPAAPPPDTAETTDTTAAPAPDTGAAAAGEAPDAPPAAPDEGDEAAAGVPAVTARGHAAVRKPSDVAYGVGLRGRVVSVPSWMLSAFTKNNVPLLTFGHFGLELFRRHRNFEIAASFSYQNMSPANGNWLGVGHDAAVDTDYVQFRGFSLYTFDVSFIWHQMFTDWFGIHYGAGIGVGLVRGQILHNDSAGCNDGNVGDLSMCHPVGVTCNGSVCTPDAALAPTRRPYDSIPPAVPIVNVVLGLDFRVPSVRGWEAKIEAGFYDAFFFGGGVAYTF